jgi:hypothetical protein
MSASTPLVLYLKDLLDESAEWSWSPAVIELLELLLPRLRDGHDRWLSTYAFVVGAAITRPMEERTKGRLELLSDVARLACQDDTILLREPSFAGSVVMVVRRRDDAALQQLIGEVERLVASEQATWFFGRGYGFAMMARVLLGHIREQWLLESGAVAL